MPSIKPPQKDNKALAGYTPYAPVKVDIMPLTEFTRPAGNDADSNIKVYVCLLDSFGCQQKSPGVFRFELYEYAQCNAEPRGRRIFIWPDIDLTAAEKNNKYWRDFLRAYEFNLDFEPQNNHNYILQATCFCPSGKRLSAQFSLKYTK